MSEGYKIRDQTLPHFITVTVVDWIDVFTRQTYKDVIIESLDYCIQSITPTSCSKCLKKIFLQTAGTVRISLAMRSQRHSHKS